MILLEDPRVDLEESARRLHGDHGDQAYQVLWRVLAGRRLSVEEAVRAWEEAVRLRERMAGALGREVALMSALVEVALAGDPALRSARLVSAARYRFLEESSYTDGLTGLYNYRFFRESFYRELKRSKRYRHPLSLLLLDLDDFKIYNDANGHPAGDRALEETARLLASNCREIDVVCRYGGEEFAVILPATDKRGARIVGEKLRRRVEDHPFGGEEACPARRLTISGGIASFPEDGLSLQELVQNADQALYQAKNFIKNAVCYYFRDERRASPRVEKECRLRYKREGEEDWSGTVTRDISRGGLSFTLAGTELALGTSLSLELDAGGRTFRLRARVVRIERLERHGAIGVGVAFERGRKRIEELLAEI